MLLFCLGTRFMSGALIRAPAGHGEGLDLTPPSVPLQTQVKLIHTFCANNPDSDYRDAVRALYRHLRGIGI